VSLDIPDIQFGRDPRFQVTMWSFFPIRIPLRKLVWRAWCLRKKARGCVPAMDPDAAWLGA